MILSKNYITEDVNHEKALSETIMKHIIDIINNLRPQTDRYR